LLLGAYERLAYLGPEGTYSQTAALTLPAAVRLPQRSIRAVFEAVEAGTCDAGLVPGENVYEGAVIETLDLLLSKPLRISGEVSLAIRHSLVGRAGQTPARVYSHPQALAQCRGWLDEHLPQAERLESLSTAEAVSLAVADPEGAAIAAGARNGLEVLESGLGLASNRTRFFVITREVAAATGADRSLIAFLAPHRPGALHACLAPFAAHGLNLSRLEHRPARVEAWTYHFIAEIEGHPETPAVAKALADLREVASEVRLLGAWPVPKA
jgi:chorismate mutase/prephenate dehydratase